MASEDLPRPRLCVGIMSALALALSLVFPVLALQALSSPDVPHSPAFSSGHILHLGSHLRLTVYPSWWPVGAFALGIASAVCSRGRLKGIGLMAIVALWLSGGELVCIWLLRQLADAIQ